jgi:hypothetical protein
MERNLSSLSYSTIILILAQSFLPLHVSFQPTNLAAPLGRCENCGVAEEAK